MTTISLTSNAAVPVAHARVASGAMTDNWATLGVRAETVEGWQALGADPFTAALAQGDGYGPSSGRHSLAGLREVAADWRAVGMSDADSLRWHRAGFSAREAAEWTARGTPLDEAALAAGHRMMG